MRIACGRRYPEFDAARELRVLKSAMNLIDPGAEFWSEPDAYGVDFYADAWDSRETLKELGGSSGIGVRYERMKRIGAGEIALGERFAVPEGLFCRIREVHDHLSHPVVPWGEVHTHIHCEGTTPCDVIKLVIAAKEQEMGSVV